MGHLLIPQGFLTFGGPDPFSDVTSVRFSKNTGRKINLNRLVDRLNECGKIKIKQKGKKPSVYTEHMHSYADN